MSCLILAVTFQPSVRPSDRLENRTEGRKPTAGGPRRDDISEDDPHHSCGDRPNGGYGAAGVDGALPPRVQRPRRNAFMVPPSALGALVDSSDDEGASVPALTAMSWYPPPFPGERRYAHLYRFTVAHSF